MREPKVIKITYATKCMSRNLDKKEKQFQKLNLLV